MVGYEEYTSGIEQCCRLFESIVSNSKLGITTFCVGELCIRHILRAAGGIFHTEIIIITKYYK